jgi:hypothetical protein
LNEAKPEIALYQRAEAGSAAVGATLAPARDADDHQLRIPAQQFIRRQSHLLKRAGPETFNEHVRGLGQAQQNFARIGMAKIDAQAAFVAAVELPTRLDVAGGPAAQGVAVVWLNLDDLGTEIAKHLRHGVACDKPRHVEHSHASERSCGVGFVFALMQ